MSSAVVFKLFLPISVSHVFRFDTHAEDLAMTDSTDQQKIFDVLGKKMVVRCKIHIELQNKMNLTRGKASWFNIRAASFGI